MSAVPIVSGRNSQKPINHKNRERSRKIITCAKLTAEQAKQKHGPQGDDCWDSSVCLVALTLVIAIAVIRLATKGGWAESTLLDERFGHCPGVEK